MVRGRRCKPHGSSFIIPSSIPLTVCTVLTPLHAPESLCLCAQEKLDWLREQLEMRTIGLSWTDWKTPWRSSRDENVGTVPQLRDCLKEVLAEETSLAQRNLLHSKTRALETDEDMRAECPAPQLQRKTFKTLGKPTAQAKALCADKTEISPEQIAAAAQKRREELEARGEIDWVGDRQPYPTGQVKRTQRVHMIRASSSCCHAS